jgi:hypothetical protein
MIVRFDFHYHYRLHTQRWWMSKFELLRCHFQDLTANLKLHLKLTNIPYHYTVYQKRYINEIMSVLCNCKQGITSTNCHHLITRVFVIKKV